MQIVAYQPEYLDLLRIHFAEHWEESGQNGIIFLPFDLDLPSRPRGIDPDAWNTPFDKVGWQRWFLALSEGRILGHANLKSDPMQAGLHRCELGMGLQTQIRGQGVGTRLLETVVDLACSVESLAWMDLRVMADNTPAIRLYQKLGFTQTGYVSERFFIQSRYVDEVTMSLDLRNTRKQSKT